MVNPVQAEVVPEDPQRPQEGFGGKAGTRIIILAFTIFVITAVITWQAGKAYRELRRTNDNVEDLVTVLADPLQVKIGCNRRNEEDKGPLHRLFKGRAPEQQQQQQFDQVITRRGPAIPIQDLPPVQGPEKRKGFLQRMRER